MYATYEQYDMMKQSHSMLENTSISDITSTSSASSQSLSHYVDQYSNSYHQLMDDLSIIDDIYDNYDHDQLSTVIDTQVACSSKNGLLKHQLVQHLIGSESQFLRDLQVYQDHIASYIRSYSIPKNNKLLFKQIDCDILFKPAQSLISIHQSFLDDLQQRLDIWGPTQLISDVFGRFFDNMEDTYYIYLKGFSETLLTLDHLQKSNPFIKALESCYQLNSNLKEIGYYIQSPLIRLKSYASVIQECLNLTEPTHPDYNHLNHMNQKFKTRQSNLLPL
ncbi:Dbl homology domain-containing protein [Cunninghamella echinulata]|nr:Dbl homology domain-containing protein [Cunninghamella echinulata]